ncbi:MULTISPECIES: hypothetical protein [Planktothricoides]|uniref:Uncharacterized protein n=1 Tax=Planktothricoides raciborskii GIHE-MW2 TaxID=2792601 RepID=A0AAU8J8V9_9CYAN|nr:MULTISPECIES: hypothetical protein [Planktothricoides]
MTVVCLLFVICYRLFATFPLLESRLLFGAIAHTKSALICRG